MSPTETDAAGRHKNNFDPSPRLGQRKRPRRLDSRQIDPADGLFNASESTPPAADPPRDPSPPITLFLEIEHTFTAEQPVNTTADSRDRPRRA